MDLDLGAVRAVVAVDDERSFSDAALMLGISQQAVSKRIAKLESSLGTRLFTRDRTTVTPTATGIRFLVHARALIVAADAAVVAVSQPRSEERRVGKECRIGCKSWWSPFH